MFSTSAGLFAGFHRHSALVLYTSLVLDMVPAGYRWIQSAHARSISWTGSMHFHTALMHLYPDPKPIIQTRSPFFVRPLASPYASSYHKELLEVLPNRCSVIREGSTCSSERWRLPWTVSITARPPAWMQKCSKAARKSGIYSLVLPLSTFLTIKDRK